MTAGRARGCDYSSAQSIRQLQATLPEISFGIVKATQGTGYVSPTVVGQVVELRKASKLVGAYHFLDPAADGVLQWDHFESVIRPLGVWWVAVDHEALEGVLPADHVVEAFIRRGAQRGYKVGRYGSAGTVMRRNLGEAWRWVAEWSPAPPALRWDVWQCSSGGNRQDFDVFRGDELELSRFVESLKPKPKPAAARWWLRDLRLGKSMGPYRLAHLAAILGVYLARHPGSVAYTLERK